MGTVTDARIAAWQKEADIEPAIGARAEALDQFEHRAQ